MDGQTFGQLSQLPDGIENNCLVGLWGGDLFSTGGSSYYTVSERAYIYSNTNDKWTQVEDMITPRERPACGAVLTGDGSQQEVIVAGGTTDLVEPSDVVEIFSIRDGDWRIASPLPSPIVEATAVPLDNSFLILGGETGSSKLSDLIYRYNAGDDTWELLDARLSTPARGVAATMVNSYIFPSCQSE